MSNDNYQGPERRSETCGNHETNTKDIAAVKSSTTPIRWVITRCRSHYHLRRRHRGGTRCSPC